MRNSILQLFYALLLILIFFAPLFISTTHSRDVKCIKRERQALLRFKQGLQDDFGMLSTWKDDEEHRDCCIWKGIGCSNETGHVHMLDLHGSDTQYLIGAINLSLLIELQDMKHLDLGWNYFLGSYIPESIDSFRELRYLNLSTTELSGRVPYQLGKLKHLRYLNLRCNFNLEGEIPHELGSLSQLKYLNLGENHLVGAIPYELGNLAQLQYLNLRGNSLAGPIPFQLRNLTQLQFLDLRGNFLVGAIPFEIGDLLMLQSLRLSGNSYLQINKQNYADARWISSLSYLKTLDLSSLNLGYSHHWLQMINKILPNLRELGLSGCGLSDNNIVPLFDSTWNISTSLTILDLSSNMLTSSTFKWLFNFSFNLQEFYLSDNNIDLSSSSLNFPSLLVLDLSYNKLTESVLQGNFNFSSNAKLLPSIVFLDLSSNLLTSSAIFHWLFNFTTNLHTLHLSNNLLEGPIPNSFGNKMNSLEYLDLSDNKLQGEIPTSFGNMSKLHTLYLFQNQITGMIPDLSTLSSLCELRLSHNQLNGEIPKSIGLLSKLEYLILNRNSLEGEVTESHFANLSRLVRLDLSDNSLSLKFGISWVPPFQLTVLQLESCKLGPSFPSWLQTQSYLMRLNISNAGIIGSVPEWFWHMSQNMYAVNISYNNLGGIIPNLPLTFTYFPIVILTSNQFEGSIPLFMLKAAALHLSHNRFSDLDSFLCGKRTIDALGILDVSNNQLKGHLPDCWDHLKSLHYLDLGNNQLSGKIPLSLGALINLKALVLRNNSLIGELPSSMKNLTNLTMLDVGENMLSGSIPSWIGESLHQLDILSLRVNHFFGRFPSQLCYLIQIKLLDLSENRLSGNIPKCLQNFTVMAEMSIINISENVSHTHNFRNNVTSSWYDFYISLMWKGVEDMFKNPELLLKSIDLSSNNLTGEIPTEFGSLFGLVSLNLSRNNLSGEITFGLGNLKSLEFLDLSRNHFSGEIPSSLAHIDRLSVLDLSNNHLIGKIPTGTQLQSFNPSSYEGNLDLCGKPLQKICSEDEVPVTQVSFAHDHEDEESIFFETFYMSLGLGFAVGFWGFIGSLLMCRLWRDSYIRFLNRLNDRIYVMVTLCTVRYNRWLTR